MMWDDDLDQELPSHGNSLLKIWQAAHKLVITENFDMFHIYKADKADKKVSFTTAKAVKG